MKLSIVIICWNDRKVLADCLESIYEQTKSTDFEVIVSDNASTDSSLEFVRQVFPQVRIVENGANVGYARGNNAGIRLAQGQYVLILNPDTLIHDRALDKWVEYADQHPAAGAFGCRVLNPDGSFQDCARPFPTISHYWKVALRLRQNTYRRWQGQTERPIDWQSGCCVMFRGDVLKNLDGFDEQFFYHYEEVDLCYRVRKAGYEILYTPDVVITHLGGQSVGRFPIRFELEKYRNRYRYFYKHYGPRGARQCRRVSLAHLRVRQCGYSLLSLVRRDEATKNRLEMLRTVATWNKRLDPIHFVEQGQEPESPHAPLTPPPASALGLKQS